MAEKIHLSGVPETMLQTIYARAKESAGRSGIHDRKAEEIIKRLDYDFSLADKDPAMHNGVIARTIVLDRLTSVWLAENPDAIVVNIACGLDTRCYRMKDYSHWYNLDLPETISVRETLLPENGTVSQIALSAMDDWSGGSTDFCRDLKVLCKENRICCIAIRAKIISIGNKNLVNDIVKRTDHQRSHTGNRM